MGSVKIVSPHHLQILCEFICECTYLHKFICKLKIKTFCAFAVTCRHAQKVKSLSHSVHISSLSWTKWCSAILFQHLQCKLHILFMVYLVLVFWILWLFDGDFCLKCPPSKTLKCCLVFLSARRPWRALWRKYVLDRFYLGIS